MMQYDFDKDEETLKNTISVLQGRFVRDEKESEKYEIVKLVSSDELSVLHRAKVLSNCLKHAEFYRQIEDIVQVGLRRYEDKYRIEQSEKTPFVLYEKYTRRDVCFLMNCIKDKSSTMYGMHRIKDDVFVFVTYHKVESEDANKNYVDGKPDYADAFEDNIIFRWDSQIGRGIDSSYVADVLNTRRKHLFIQKSDAEVSFYYMGQFDVVDVVAAKKEDNKGKERDITKFRFKMHHAVREDLLRYLQSKIKDEGEKVG